MPTDLLDVDTGCQTNCAAKRMARPPQFMSTFFKQGGDFLAELL
jgi:hypothetical protein